MSDRHLRRLGQDYGTAFLSLLPQGQAWPKYPGSTLDLACRGLAEYWGFVDGRAADLLERESDPRYTVELLPDWERNWGLPDPCYEAPQTYAERIAELLRRMTMLGAQSRQFFIDLAASIGYTITITEYRTFVVGIDRVGDSRVYGAAGAPDPIMRNEWGNPIMNARGDGYVAEGELSEWPYYGLGPETNRFYWTVHVEEAKLVWFRCASGQCGVDPHLRIGLADDLECLLNRWKPAHTQIIFDYSGLELPAPAPPTPLAWSPTDHSVFITISGGDTVATRNSTLGGTWNTARSDTSRSSGLHVVMFTILDGGPTATGDIILGVSNAAEGYGTFVGASINSAGYWTAGASYYNGGFSGHQPASPAEAGKPDEVYMEVDLNSSPRTVRWKVGTGGTYGTKQPIDTLGPDVFVACSLKDTVPFASVKVEDAP